MPRPFYYPLILLTSTQCRQLTRDRSLTPPRFCAPRRLFCSFDLTAAI